MNQNKVNLFANFIHKTCLVDIPCKGKKYMGYSGDGKSISRIDQFLLSDEVVDKWGVVGKFMGARDISDHCPLCKRCFSMRYWIWGVRM